MYIHTVKSGDTLFKIAREYATSPMKIIENNGLENPDRLSVGQKLLILTPTRTYTVRGSDSLEKIAERFGVKYNSLLSANPYLSGTNRLYPGQLLTVKHDAPLFGVAAANGYLFKGTPRDRLELAIPYSAYITVCAARRRGDGIELIFDDTDSVKLIRERTRVPLLRVYDEDTEFPDGYVDNLLQFAKTRGYGGVTLANYRAQREAPEALAEFLMRLKRRAMECDLLLFSELDGNTRQLLPDVCDGYVVMYEKCSLDEIPSFKDGEGETMKYYAENSEPSKIYIDIPSLGYMGDEEITKGDAEALAYSAGREILYDPERKICTFHYNKYLAGKRESVRVA